MRNACLAAAVLTSCLATLSAQAGVVYQDIFLPDDPTHPNKSVTGIRRDVGPSNPVVITGSYESPVNNKPQALLYEGPIYPTDPTGFYYPTPFPEQMVNTSIFYGPNTSLFDPSLGGNIRAVGSYQYDGNKFDHGMMYVGSLDGSGTWTPIDVPSSLVGKTVADTIPHSTMGNLVVGNYDLEDSAGNQDPATGSASIYNNASDSYTLLNLGPLTTAYGIWQNGDSSSAQYTIAGGYDEGGGIDKGFLLDYDSSYDSSTGSITHLTPFSGFNDPGLVTHFEGISGVDGGYTLAATTDSGAAFASVSRNDDGSFGPASWVPIADPNSIGLSTGNTVIDNNLLGVYTPAGGGLQSYVATVPEPSALSLLGIGIAGLPLLRARGRRRRRLDA
jgi:hypothetical protein